MSPALDPGDYVIVNTWAYRRREPAIGVLVVLRDPQRDARFLCKRVAEVEASGLYIVLGDSAHLAADVGIDVILTIVALTLARGRHGPMLSRPGGTRRG